MANRRNRRNGSPPPASCLSCKNSSPWPTRCLWFTKPGRAAFTSTANSPPWESRAFVVHPQKLDPQHKGVVTDKTDARELTLNLDRYLRGNLRAMSVVRVPTPPKNNGVP